MATLHAICEALAQTRREHDDIITAVLHNSVAVKETATQQSLEQAEIETDQTEAADADSLEPL